MPLRGLTAPVALARFLEALDWVVDEIRPRPEAVWTEGSAGGFRRVWVALPPALSHCYSKNLLKGGGFMPQTTRFKLGFLAVLMLAAVAGVIAASLIAALWVVFRSS